jgi:AGZA family xanthine/uracil permease-like MFS transporter
MNKFKPRGGKLFTMDKFFKLKENGTNVKTEIIAGITTFMTMSYILIVNPDILSATGMDRGAVFTATALASALATLTMALLANYPIALAPGMGLNAYFAFAVVLGMGYSWEIALTAVFFEGIIFIILTLFRFREAIVNSIPQNLKYGVTVGIGLFITFIGFQNAGIIAGNPDTMVSLGDLTSITVILSIIGILGTTFMLYKKVKGALLWGILGTYVLGIICQVIGLYVVNPEAGTFNLIPQGIISLPPSLAPIFWKFDFAGAWSLGLDFLVVMFAFLFVDLFDTVGTLIGVGSKANLLDKEGNLPKVKEALMADAVGTTAGAILGTSTVTSYVESASGVAEGGKTGLTSLTTSILFIIALIFSPVLTIIPGFATAPALVIVGLLMISAVTKIDFSNDFTEALPAFLAMIIMPLAYSIADGIMFGIMSWFILKLVAGKIKQIHPVVYLLVVLFILKIVL